MAKNDTPNDATIAALEAAAVAAWEVYRIAKDAADAAYAAYQDADWAHDEALSERAFNAAVARGEF